MTARRKAPDFRKTTRVPLISRVFSQLVFAGVKAFCLTRIDRLFNVQEASLNSSKDMRNRAAEKVLVPLDLLLVLPIIRQPRGKVCNSIEHFFYQMKSLNVEIRARKICSSIVRSYFDRLTYIMNVWIHFIAINRRTTRWYFD